MNFESGGPSPFVIGVGIFVVAAIAPLLITDSLVTSLTATPLRQAASAFILLAGGGAVAFWAVSRVSIRVTSAVEGPQGGED